MSINVVSKAKKKSALRTYWFFTMKIGYKCFTTLEPFPIFLAFFLKTYYSKNGIRKKCFRPSIRVTGWLWTKRLILIKKIYSIRLKWNQKKSGQAQRQITGIALEKYHLCRAYFIVVWVPLQRRLVFQSSNGWIYLGDGFQNNSATSRKLMMSTKAKTTYILSLLTFYKHIHCELARLASS